MSYSVVSKKYAKALSQLTGLSSEDCEPHLNSLENVEKLFALSEAKTVLCSPVMPKGVKKALLEYAVNSGATNKVCTNFLNLLVDSGRVEVLPDIIEDYRSLLVEKLGLTQAVVYSAENIGDEALGQIKVQLEQIFSCKVALKCEIRKDLLGGFAVHVGNSIIDMSLKTKLSTITSTKFSRGIK